MFKEGRRRAAVRSLGKVVHYAKVQLRFQHSQVGAGLEEGMLWGGATLEPATESSDAGPSLP